MSRFTQPQVLVPYCDLIFDDGFTVARPDEKRWVVALEDFVYEIGELGSGEEVHVPQGFVTDLASVPPFLWVFIPPFGLHGRAAVLHDFLYRDRSMKNRFDRKQADDMFLEAMNVIGVPKGRARLMWCAVRLFGWFSWSNEGATIYEGEMR